MRILILGGDGMLGHRLLKHLSHDHDVRVTLRRSPSDYERYGLFDEGNAYYGVEVLDHDKVTEVVADFKPEAVVNAVGIVKQRGAAKEAIPSLEVNSLLPHRLALLCRVANARLVHVSTDCVFSGKKGNYLEEDVPDAEDLYGRTKLLGEVAEPGAVTLRTSIIGLELSRKTGLVEWFLAQSGGIRGFRRAIYTGLTTAELSRVVEKVLIEHPELHGVWQVASEPINKYELLVKFSEVLGREDVEITPDDAVKIDRSLLGVAFSKATGYSAPGWDEMLQELGAEVRERQVKTV